jgi:tRNA(fMet)-specific endonuclease VapC
MKCALLDTDACIEIIRGNDAPIRAFPDFTFAISSITQFEILSGLKGRKGSKVEKRAMAFLDLSDIRGFCESAARASAKICLDLETRGQPIGAYDLLLAGQAKALELPLITGNEREFNRVPGLTVLTWPR